MGLDMYLTGEKSISFNDRRIRKEDGFEIDKIVLELGYWRKHPNLHGYIVQEFLGGKDECQKVYLDKDDMLKIQKAISEDNLPYTNGFFFGQSPKLGTKEYNNQKTEDYQIFEKAIQWLETESDDSWRSVYYQASW